MPTHCLACNAVIETEPHYYLGKSPVCSQAYAATKEVHPARRALHTPGPLAVSRGNTGDHSFYIAAGRLDEKSGMTFFDRHVAWVTRKEDADLFVAAPELLEAAKGMLDWARRVHASNPGPEIARATAAIAKAGGSETT